MKASQKKVRAYLQYMLSFYDGWAIKGLLRIYDNQTADEQSLQMTRHWNKIGFTAFDAEFLSSLAEQYRQFKALSPKQMKELKRRLPSYWKQLSKMSNEEMLDAQTTVWFNNGGQIMAAERVKKAVRR